MAQETQKGITWDNEPALLDKHRNRVKKKRTARKVGTCERSQHPYGTLSIAVWGIRISNDATTDETTMQKTFD